MEGRGKRVRVGELAPREQGNRESPVREREVCPGKEPPAGAPPSQRRCAWCPGQEAVGDRRVSSRREGTEPRQRAHSYFQKLDFESK